MGKEREIEMPIPLLKPSRKPIYDTEPIKNRRSKKTKAAKRRKPALPPPTLPAIQAPVEKGVTVPFGLENLKKEKVGSDGSKDSVHYGGADNPHEVIKCLEAWGLEKDALLWNAVKYISRAGKKSETPILKDLKKALYYLKRRVEKLEEQIEKETRKP